MENWVDALIINKLKNKDNLLISKVEILRDKIEPLLAQIKVTFPEYTLHDVRHSDQIVYLFDEIIPESLMESMNKWELFFLTMSAYLHDIGMCDIKEIFDKDTYNEFLSSNNLKNNKDTYKLFIRKYHHIRSDEYIKKFWKELGIDDLYQAKIIGNICKGHRVENLNDIKKYNPEFKYNLKQEKL
jgi:HD superfamily phosphodiesterase